MELSRDHWPALLRISMPGDVTILSFNRLLVRTTLLLKICEEGLLW